MIAAITRRFTRTLFAAACLLALCAAPLATPQAVAAYDQQPALSLPAPGVQPDGLTPPALDDVNAIAAGWLATCALTQAGTVYCWGTNYNVGFGEHYNVPVPIQFGDVPVASISVGRSHACAVTAAGGARCWGTNDYGELGSTSPTTFSPVDVTGLASGVAAVGAGGDHTCALTTAGGVKCWGGNTWGQLGDGTTTNRPAPVDVAGLATGIQAISLGYGSTCALTTGGEVKCWGHNADGQLGDGTYTDRTTPVLVAGLSGATAIASGGIDNSVMFTGHTCALIAAPGAAGGDLKCWGRNVDGELGDGTVGTNRSTPVSVVGFAPGEIQAVTAGYGYTCALTTAGAVKCWGSNSWGQLGDGTTASRTTPAVVGSLSAGVQAVAAAERHACAIVAGGSAAGGTAATRHVECWGNNDSWQLGNYALVYRLPTAVPAAGSDVQALAAVSNRTCVLRGATPGGANAWCWGDNYWGQLGDGTTASRVLPGLVAGLAGRVRAIALGQWHTCALVSGAGAGETNAMCWGNNDDGQLGDGTHTQALTPVAVQGLGSSVFAISAGVSHTCAVVGSASAGGGVKCWGSNSQGQLGDNSNVDHPLPVDVAGLRTGVAAVAAGNEYTCALTTAGGVKCWGIGFRGELGDGTGLSRSRPVDVKGLTRGVVAIVTVPNSFGTYSGQTCALTTAGDVKCWGVGNLEPAAVYGLDSGVQAVALGPENSCAILAGGDLVCWGDNRAGQLGNGGTDWFPLPQRVKGLAGPVTAVAVGMSHACAVAGGSLQCWGSASYGELALNNGWLPVPVITPAAWHFLPAVWHIMPTSQ